LIDGVFIPDGRAGPVQVESTGHTFEGFPNSDNRSPGYIWAGGAVPLPPTRPTPIPTVLNNVDYSTDGHGLLWLPPNKGITFDLDAIRRANPGRRVLRFRSTAGNTYLSTTGGNGRESADLWVLVDGRVRFQRRDIELSQGAFSMSVPIGEKERFLTLATTDGGNDVANDWTMFGDPRLELLPARAGILENTSK
jgi:hypothetical protein